MRAVLVLEDGTKFEGLSAGVPGTTIGEVVFATGMTGYQEMLTDPSFAGQILTLTYPLIGNYGTNPEDIESNRVQVEGFVVREICDSPSNWRMSTSLRDYLIQNRVIAIEGVDTRALTRHLRVRGVMMGAISTELTTEELLGELEKAPNYGDINFVERVSTKVAYEFTDDCSKSSTVAPHVAVIDLGLKRNIVRCLVREGCRVTVLPCNASASDILAYKPDGVVFSPGPGDPKRLASGVETIRSLIGKVPIMGICLGHQMLGLAFGGETFKLKFGHRGANHPVKNLVTGKVSITAQNHGYAVDPENMSRDVQVDRINLHDGTVEGLRHRELPIVSIQYHPEASAGPLDEQHLFGEFVGMLSVCRNDS
ncbi:MAG: glutamine-hydrolyzing carbamoyl-phosphate synthase small subunit [Armatimonadota bacterium]|nr:glutamine-hydrolyzing carbamoyl-phosphate synthase small subunit [Armatimonadota bacterium]